MKLLQKATWLTGEPLLPSRPLYSPASSKPAFRKLIVVAITLTLAFCIAVWGITNLIKDRKASSMTGTYIRTDNKERLTFYPNGTVLQDTQLGLLGDGRPIHLPVVIYYRRYGALIKIYDQPYNWFSDWKEEESDPLFSEPPFYGKPLHVSNDFKTLYLAIGSKKDQRTILYTK